MAREDSTATPGEADGRKPPRDHNLRDKAAPDAEEEIVEGDDVDYQIDADKARARRIRDLGDDEKPREKLLAHGPSALSNAELLGLLLRVGLPGQNAVDLGRELLGANGGSLTDLSRAALSSLQETPGVGPAKSAELGAVFELAARLARERIHRAQLDCPEAVYDFVGPGMSSLDREVVRVILVNARQRHIRTEDVAIGSINECVAHPAFILKPVIAYSAYGFFLLHNHPSGDPSPSSNDRSLTRRLSEACALMDIKFIDHIIIGSRADDAVSEPYFSFQEMGLL